MRVQGYDGGAKISGKFRGLQDLVFEQQSMALHAHCFIHSLNLSVSKACQIPVVRNMLGTVTTTTERSTY